MPLSRLTEKERLVFYNIVKYPQLNDTELSDKIGIKRSTISSIRNRLKADGFYKPAIIPNLAALGCRLLGIMYGKFNTRMPFETRKDTDGFKKILDQPELVFAVSTDTEFIGIYISEHLFDIMEIQNKFIADYKSRNFLESYMRIFYPFELCNICALFDYSKILAHLFGTEVSNDMTAYWKDKKTELDATEKLVLYNMIKFPEASNLDIAKNVKKTRATVSKIRKRLVDEGIVKFSNILNMEKLGCELMVFFHAKLNPKFDMAKRIEGVNLTLKESFPFFIAFGDMESVGISILKNFTEHKQVHNKIVGFYKDCGFMEEDPHILFFPINQVKTNKFDFAPLVEKLLFKK